MPITLMQHERPLNTEQRIIVMVLHCLSVRLVLTLLTGSLVGWGALPPSAAAQAPAVPRPIPPPPGYMEAADKALAEPFRGITTDGTVIPGLFTIQKTGISTQPITEAAEAFLAALHPEQRAKTLYPVDSDEWRRWSNIHRYPRQGVALTELTPSQREKASADYRSRRGLARGLQPEQRATWGRASLRISSRLLANSGAMRVNPVMLPPGRARLATT